MEKTHNKLSKVVFRLCGLPNTVESTDGVKSLVNERLDDIPIHSIHVYSLATTLNHWESPPSKVATIMFDTIPSIIWDSPEKNQWSIPSRSSHAHHSLVLDTHFLGMTPLNDVEPNSSHLYDCIAISSLASHPFGSWQPKGDDKTFMWIRDCLPKDLPSIRTIIYGYDTKLDYRNSFQRISDLADELVNQLQAYGWGQGFTKPAAFLAHSLGGLVLKKALVQLDTYSHDASLPNLVRGAVFFGVPNMGMEQEHFRAIVQNNANEALIDEISPNSNFLRRLDQEFRESSFKKHIKCFWAYETSKSPTIVINKDGNPRRDGPPAILVDRESATCGLIRHDRAATFPINASHSDMVNFRQGSHDYHIVISKLSDILSSNRHLKNSEEISLQSNDQGNEFDQFPASQSLWKTLLLGNSRHQRMTENDLTADFEAFKRESTLTDTEENNFQNTTFNDVQNVIRKIQRDSQIYMKRLEPILVSMQQFSEIAKSLKMFSNVSYAMGYVWGPMKYVLLVAFDFFEALHPVLDAYQDIGEQIPHLQGLEGLLTSSPLYQDILNLIYKDILRFHREVIRLFKQRQWKQLFKASWTDFSSTIDHIKGSLARKKRSIENGLSITEFEEIQTSQSTADREFDREKASQDADRRAMVLQWLSPFDCESEQARFRDVRSICRDPGRWLLNDSRFQKWFNPEDSVTPALLLSGKPGAGKTILASIIVDEIRKVPGASIAFFYCKYGEKTRNTFLSVARSILAQMLVQNPRLLSLFHEKASISSDAVLRSTTIAKEMIQTTLRSCQKTYLIIDGIDECGRGDRKKIASSFQEILEEGKESLRCLFVSQDDAAISQGYFRNLPTIMIIDENQEDLKNFSTVWQQRIEEKFGNLRSKNYNLLNIISARANGIFIFAELFAKYLEDQISQAALIEELNPTKLPVGLDHVYERILDRILESRGHHMVKHLRHVLGWIVCARRPLRWREIQAAISIDLEEQCINYDKEISDSPKGLFASLIELQADGTVELVHGTARDYLIRNFIDLHETDYSLAMLSLGYLTFPQVDKQRSDVDIRSDLLSGTHAFYDYASAYWDMHLQECISKLSEGDKLTQLQETLETFVEWHWSADHKPLPDVIRIRKALEKMQESDLYDKITQAVGWAKKQSGKQGMGPNKDEALDLWKVTAKLRSTLEDMKAPSTSEAEIISLQRFYGMDWFKCPRVNCYHYHQGFRTAKQRKRHVDRHDLSGCPDSVQLLLEKDADVNAQGGYQFDDNYRDYTITTQSRYMSDQVFTAEQKTDFNTQSASLSEMEDLQTVYSDNFSVKGSIKVAYVDELVRELLIAISSFRIDSLSMRRVAEAMPDCLKAFSLRLSSADSSQQVHQDVSAFIRKYKQDITDTFLAESLDDLSSARMSGPGDMAVEEIMERWWKHDPNSGNGSSTTWVPGAAENMPLHEKHDSNLVDYETWSESITESDKFPDSEGGNPAAIDLYPKIETDEALHSAMPQLQKYRECIFGNLAYDWLLSDLLRHCLLTPSSPDVMAEIGRAIMQSLPSQVHFSRREPPLPYKMSYNMDWDLVSFLKDQEYSEDNFNALPLVITVTGSREAAQALTCSQYLHQVWPLSARDVVKLLQTLLESRTKDRAAGTLQDGTRLVAWFQSTKNSKRCKIVVEVIGSAYSVSEVGEQLSWLGSALRSSPHPDQVTYCQPRVENFQVINDKAQSTKRQYAAEVSADISFAIAKTTSSQTSNGECWHDLFRNCVVVEGYPISRRPEMGATSGLEIPLPMVASLMQASYVNNFLGSLIIKGFSAMLVPTNNYNGFVVWHLVHNKNGDRISYLDNTVVPVKGLIAGQLSKARHILGWCSETSYLAGTRDAKYDVLASRLPRAHGNGILSQAFISSGQMITGGEPFLIGYKDTPFHVSRVGYLSKLKWIFKKSVVLWDEEVKRGWMLNGATALLHLVRASIVHDKTGPFSSECLFRWESLEEGPAHSTRTPESAIAVLLNPTNRAMTIYEGKDEHVTFESRVKHFFNILEQIFDYQIHAVGPDASGYSSMSISRAHFEGWDFHDLATESDPLHPRLANIASKGKAWIDFTRSIHSINLLGRGFGEILEPSSLSCPYWGSLPKDQYYLAAGTADLKMVLEYTGDLKANPIRLSENLVWCNPETVFDPCDCTDATADHADIVQVILPATVLSNPEQCNDPINLAQNGAVIFGYNRNFQWRWGDAGDPERDDDIKANDEEHFPSIYEDGYDNSNSLSAGSVCGHNQLSSIQAPSIEETIATSSSDKGSQRPKPRVRSYTKWNLGSLRAEHYTVGIVCALPLELLAVRALFDQTHPDLSLSAADTNHYALGSIGKHKVVAACLPDGEYGTNSAADVALNLKRSFTSVKLCLLVGIGGGVSSSRNDIRLGDVVVSKPTDTSSGVIQYDMGKALENGIFEQKGFLHPPPRIVMTALSSLKSDPYLPQAPLQEYIKEIAACRKEYRYPGPENDRLFSSLYVHDSKHATCDHCSAVCAITRVSRSDHNPRIHYGLVASGNSVMKDAKLRDRWSMDRNILCFEMEAAGIMNTLPCLVIRGICDYSDSHKNDRFQEYAAATAASYAKLLLSYMKDSSDVDGMALHSTKDDQSLLGIIRRALSKFPSAPRSLNGV